MKFFQLVKTWIQIVLLTGLFQINFSSSAQIIIPMNELEKNGISLNDLNRMYPNAHDSNTTNGPFQGREKEFETAFMDFIMGTQIIHMKIDTSFMGVLYSTENNLYFSPDGKVDYWFYTISGKNLPDDMDSYYQRVLQKACESKLSIQAETKFQKHFWETKNFSEKIR